MERKIEHIKPDGIEARMLCLFQRMQQLELGKLPQNEIDLTMAQMQVIRFVGENPDCHLQELAEGVGVSSPTASVSIRRLEEAGLIAREPDPEDGRATCLRLTKKSFKAFQQVKQRMFDRMERFLSHLSEEEQNQLINLMEKAVNGIEKAARQTK